MQRDGRFLGWIPSTSTNLIVVEYVKSLIGTNGGFFSPTDDIGIYTTWNDWGNLGIRQPEWLSEARDAFVKLYNCISRIPIIDLSYKVYFYSWIIPCFAVWKAIKQKSVEMGIFLSPVLLVIVTLFLSPIVISRYALNIIMIAPLLICITQESFSTIGARFSLRQPNI